MTLTSLDSIDDLRSRHGVSPASALSTRHLVGPAGADVFVDPTVAQEALDKARGGLEAWKDASELHGSVSLLGAVALRAAAEAELVAALSGQVIGDTDQSDKIAELEERLFDYYNPDLFRGALEERARLIADIQLPLELEAARADLLDEFDGYIKHGPTAELAKPEPKTLERMGEWAGAQFGDIFEEIDARGQREFAAPEIVEVLQLSMDSTPDMRGAGWRAREVVRDKSAISTFASKREIVVSSQRVVDAKKLKMLVVHEVFGHGLRSAAAERHDIPAGRVGTATYARFEESFMLALEQCVAGEYDSSRGLNHYISVGLSVTEGRSKDEIARTMESMHMISKAEHGIDDAVRQAALRLTGSQINRTFVGMTDVDDGIAHRKDIDYLHGLNQSWQLLNFIVENDIVDEAMAWILSAKFNPFTKSERELVNQYVPMPKALEEFFG